MSSDLAITGPIDLVDPSGLAVAAQGLHVPPENRPLSSDARTQAERLGELSGLPLLVLEHGRVFEVSEGDLPWVPQVALEPLKTAPPRSRPRAMEIGTWGRVVAASLPCGAVAIATLPRHTDQAIPTEAIVAAAAYGWDHDRTQQWWESRPVHDATTAVRLLALATTAATADEQRDRLEWELESLADQIDSTYEEITLLHYLAQNLQRTHDTTELAQLCLDRIGDSLHATGGVAWLQVGEGNAHFLVEGEVPFDEFGLARLVAAFPSHPWPQPLVRNHMQHRDLGVQQEGLESLVVVPIHAGTAQVGWLACVNGRDGREFGTVEASLLASIGVTLGTHVQNAEAVRDREEMLLSFVRSFVSSLDAKDAYTRGHSQRVARIARAIAVQIGLPHEEVEAIHLAGLLHDIGKIGIDDAVLCKPDRLTEDEFEQIKRHPTIGYQILSNIRSLAHILPGVRNHHESWDGTGYPDGLAGEAIPMQARILAVADSYDAMTSDRPYRTGMPLERLQAIFTEGRGEQWDPVLIDAYFAIADDVLALCEAWKAEQGEPAQMA